MSYTWGPIISEGGVTSRGPCALGLALLSGKEGYEGIPCLARTKLRDYQPLFECYLPVLGYLHVLDQVLSFSGTVLCHPL